MITPEAEAKRAIEKCAADVRRLARQCGGVPPGGWLRAMRVAAGTAQGELAAKLGCKRQAWPQFEASEARGAISLASLQRTADALDCDVVYFVVPRRSAGGRSTRDAAAVSPGPVAASPHSVPTEVPAETTPADVAGVWPGPELPTELL